MNYLAYFHREYYIFAKNPNLRTDNSNNRINNFIVNNS